MLSLIQSSFMSWVESLVISASFLKLFALTWELSSRHVHLCCGYLPKSARSSTDSSFDILALLFPNTDVLSIVWLFCLCVVFVFIFSVLSGCVAEIAATMRCSHLPGNWSMTKAKQIKSIHLNINTKNI